MNRPADHRPRSGSVFPLSRRLGLATLALLLGACAAAPPPETPRAALVATAPERPIDYSRIVAFGDSLSSGGRGRNGPSTGPAPTADNGGYPRLTWVQQLSDMAGLGALVKWEEGGGNYAVGGTTTAQLAEQVSRYLKAHDGRADPAALHTLWSGGNDLTHRLRDLHREGGFFALFGLEKTLVATAEEAADTLAAQIDRLAATGAKHVLWVNLPDLSHTPSLAARTASFPGLKGLAERAFRRASNAFNARMTLALGRLRAAHPGLDVVVLDAHAFFDRLMADPAAYGFTDVRTPSRTSNQHLFFDNTHPTAHGHYQFARFARDQLVALGRISPAAAKDSFEARLTPVTPNAPVVASTDKSRPDEDEARFVADVRAWIAIHPVIRRPHTLAELKSDPAFKMKYREKPAHLARADDAAWERFALSLADSEAARTFSRALPGIATAARLTGEPVFLDYLRAQLAELATWAPLQRAGWSGGSATPGAWLGTGWSVRAIVQTLAQLPEDALPAELHAALHARLEAEIAGIREDWRTRRTWFARIEAASSNQWVLPLEALALASLHTGLDRHREDFEFAVTGLLRTLDAQGRNGECVEGMQYAGITFESLLSAALAARSFGDERLFRHPWLHAFPAWYLHHRQPGGFVINAFDSQNHDLDWNLVAQLAADLQSPAALWALRRRSPLPGTPPSLALFHAGQLRGLPETPPSPFAAYPAATRVNWLESVAAFEAGPANRVSGFWMRGGHASDAHDHQDRGHVNFIVKGRPVLIEAGLSSYGIPEHPTHFRSVAGHNVLQVGPYSPGELSPGVLAGAGQILDPAHRPAPLEIRRLDASGGEAVVDASACYAGVRRWVRTAAWDASTVTVRDEVELAQPDIILFRWHLGESAEAEVTFPEPGLVRVGDIVLAYETTPDAAVTARVEAMPDHTLQTGTVGRHATVVLATDRPARTLVLTTRARLQPR